MPQNKRDPLIRTEISQPVPKEDTFDANNNIFLIGLDQRQESLRVSWEILMGKNSPS
jgi:hypothetical protein